MTWWQAIILGIVQGITEFLPVSSSGHLAIIEHFFSLQDATLTFDIMLHLGTLVAVILFFRKQLLSLRREMAIKVILATLPLVFLGVVLKPIVESFRLNITAMIVTYAFTAVLLLMADRFMVLEKENRLWSTVEKLHARITGQDPPTYLQAMIVGIFQVFAVLPGVSRSGTTVAAGIFSGIPAEEAFSFAFLISIPAVAGAVTLDLFDVMQMGSLSSLPWSMYLIGAVTSLIVGWGALSILKWFVTKRKLWPFALYCAFISILLVFLA
jgi:undecaprenyl-diphosphatase